MFSSASIFLDFSLPNATTWFYFSFLLAIAFFFKFSRLLSVRNLDVLTLFLLVPGLLLIQRAPQAQVAEVVALVGNGASSDFGTTLIAGVGARGNGPTGDFWMWLGYLWLFCGSGYYLIRCLCDLALVQRPALSANLTFGGLAWLATALLLCLAAVAFRSANNPLSGSSLSGTGAEQGKIVQGSKLSFVADETPLLQRPWVKRSFAIAGHFFVVLGLFLVCTLHFQDAAAGMAAATFYLLLPYTGYNVSLVHHVWPAALILWAVLAYRLPMLSGIFLGLAAATCNFFPALILPVWVSFYWKRGVGRFMASFLLAVVVIFVICAWDERIGALIQPVGEVAASWQPWKAPKTEGFWTEFHWAYRIPIFFAYVALAFVSALWPAPKNLAQLIALSAALLIGIQFWYGDRGGTFVLWYLPLLLLMVFRPNLSERRPALLTDRDWLTRIHRAARALASHVWRRGAGTVDGAPAS